MSDKSQAPEPEVPLPDMPEPDASTTLRVEGPQWCTSFTFPLGEGRTLRVDRKGVDVPTKAASALIDIAAQHGVTIRSI